MAELEFDHITTRGGDGGKTSLIGGDRRFKSDTIFEVLGDFDEASSAIGLARSALKAITTYPEAQTWDIRLRTIQHDLVILCGQIATPPPREAAKTLSEDNVTVLEEWQKASMSGLEIRGFIMPGANEVSARLDLARTIVRRAERNLVRYIQEYHAQHLRLCQVYTNRLSDYLFVLARKYALDSGQDET